MSDEDDPFDPFQGSSARAAWIDMLYREISADIPFFHDDYALFQTADGRVFVPDVHGVLVVPDVQAVVRPSAIIPPDQRGSKKPGGGASAKPRPTEKGFRVVGRDLYFEMPIETTPGDTFITPDIALLTAKKRAKAGKECYLIFRDGVLWQTVEADGSVA